MKVYQVILVDGDGVTFDEHPTHKVFMDRDKAAEYRQQILSEESGWFRVYIKELEVVE